MRYAICFEGVSCLRDESFEDLRLWSVVVSLKGEVSRGPKPIIYGAKQTSCESLAYFANALTDVIVWPLSDAI